MDIKDIERLVAPEFLVNTDGYTNDLWIVQNPKCFPKRPTHPASVEGRPYCYADMYLIIEIVGDKILCGYGDGYHRCLSKRRSRPETLKKRAFAFYKEYQDNDTTLMRRMTRKGKKT